MKLSPPILRKGMASRKSGTGFALVASMLAMALLMILGLGLMTLATIELRRSGATLYEAEARAKARLSLMLALGDLQHYAGPDTRATAEAGLLGEAIANPHWTGVWNTRGNDGKPLLKRDDRNGGLTDPRQAGLDRETSVMTWLASGGASPRTEIGPEAIELVSGRNDPAARRVTAKRVMVDAGKPEKGGYAWWVGDLGVRANVATPDAFEGKQADVKSPGDGGWFRRMLAQEADASLLGGPVDAAGKSKLVTDPTRHLAATRWDPTRFHDFTVHSEGVLADMEAGGLKRDLTAYLTSEGRIDDRDGLPGLSDNDNLVGPANAAAATRDGLDWTSTRHRFTSPKFGLLRKWARDAVPFEGNGVAAVLPKTEDSPRVSESNSLALSNLSPVAIGSLDAPNRVPTLVEGSLGFTFSWHRTGKLPGGGAAKYPYQVRIHIYPRIVLWNPYNVELELDRTIAMIQGNGRQEMWTDIYYPPNKNLIYRAQWIWFEGGRSSNFVPTGGSILDSEGYKDPYMGCFYFSLPKTKFKPGECLVFTLEKGAEYERPLTAGSNNYSLEKNALSCETSPDPSKNYYLSNDELDGGISFIPTTYWFEPTTAWKAGGIANQGDDCRVILKKLGDRNNITFEEFDALPQISMVSASLQYGAGREPRLAWSKVEKMPVEETATVDPKATIAPNVRTREGIRLRWNNETRSNLLGSGALSGTAHFDEALLGNWNARASYVTRTPWDNLAGTLPKSGTDSGPWFFGAYTRDLYDQAVSWQDQMPVYQDGRYHGNPFGTPQEAVGPIVLFDVPRSETGVISIGQFQHAKLSEFIWHPSYAVGQSLVDPRGPAGKSAGLTRTSPLFKDSTEASAGGFSIEAIGYSIDAQRAANREAWAHQGRAIFQDYPATDNLVYDLSYEVNRTLWDAFFLSGADQKRAEAFVSDPRANPLPNGRLRLFPKTGNATTATDLRDLHRAASRLVVDGAFNVNSLSAEAWKAVLCGARAASPDGKLRFPRVLSAPGKAWTSGSSPTDASAWNGERVLTDEEIDRLAKAIVVEVRKRAPFLSLADFVNRRLADDATGRMGPLQAAIDAAGLNSAFDSAYPLNNSKSLPDYSHPDQIRDATRLEQTLKPASKAWGASAFLTQGDVLQVIGPMLNARSDTFIIRGYGDAADSSGTIRSRAWCEAIVQRTPEPLKPDLSGLNSADAGKPNDFGRRFVVKSFRWLKREEI